MWNFASRGLTKIINSAQFWRNTKRAHFLIVDLATICNMGLSKVFLGDLGGFLQLSKLNFNQLFMNSPQVSELGYDLGGYGQQQKFE